ncbi:MAG: hypothetical protein WBA07_09575 [Rivularia sp. (in: cyanobacteria)]
MTDILKQPVQAVDTYSDQDACPGGHSTLAERDDSLRQHYDIFCKNWDAPL